ncbi:S-layer homology domain-containing protein [Selenomonas montiformis]|uniref:S-layer homology domain-containing protein n=1 Tax=Selenomonas montiformis TaxID=2652285 RepID=UPI002A878F5C|nr:S-layer homology domain-containing protein [Selenomonas montiformis]
MNKKAMTAAVLAALSVPAATGYAAQNPFKDLPEGHWAYDAVTMLARDGVIEGYGDGTFRGDRGLNRYEMAELVSKAMEKYATARPADRGAIKKLKREFASELSDIDDRLTAVESDVKDLKKTQSSFKWFGDARFRSYWNKNGTQFKTMKAPGGVGTGKELSSKNSRQLETRVRLGIWAQPADNVTVQGRLKLNNVTDKNDSYDEGKIENSNNDSVRLDRMEFNYQAKNGWAFDIGRMEKSFGQGLIWWENPIDGFAIHKSFGQTAAVQFGWGDLTAENWGGKGTNKDKWMPAFFADGALHLSKASTVTASYLKAHTDSMLDVAKVDDWGWLNSWNKKQRYELNQFAVGMNTQLAPKWRWTAEYVRNNIETSGRANKDGFWSRIYYGNLIWSKANTWHVFGEWAALGNYAIDSTNWGHHMNFAGGNGLGSDNGGVRGWGLGMSYMLAPSTNLEFTYYKLKPFDTSFGEYRDTGYAAFTYSF